MLITILKEKEKIRKNMRFRRKSLHVLEQYNESIKIAKISLNFSLIHNSKNIALFLPFDGEINTYPLILNLWKKKIFFFQ